MTRKYLKFTDYLVEKLKNPTEAEAFLDAATTAYEEDGDTASFMLALRYLTEAQGGVRALSERTHLDRKNLYKVLTGKTKPGLATTMSIIKGLGFHLVPKVMRREHIRSNLN
ncbi:MAG: transcriptional regulator [Candidatus Midichloriaceae bacterium]|jgi:probable addiction module antidote protein|nr:transcriptional regulator [Candidatus Midichloriaceae bacterium]